MAGKSNSKAERDWRDEWRPEYDDLTMDFSYRDEPWANVTITLEGVDSDDDVYLEETFSDTVTAYGIVVAICSFVVDIDRVTLAERLSADADGRPRVTVFIDGTSKKPLCRLYIFDQLRQIGLFDGSRVRPGGAFSETRFAIEEVEDIFIYGGQLQQTAKRYTLPRGHAPIDLLDPRETHHVGVNPEASSLLRRLAGPLYH